MSTDYVHPEVLVSTQWVEAHRHETDTIRIVESDEDVLLYHSGHIPGAVKIDWVNDLNDPVIRDFVDEQQFAALCAKHGIDNDTTVVFYGDKSNWWACYAFWIFKLHGHEDCRIMNGGRKKWELEKRPMADDRPSYPRASYHAPAQDLTHRAFRVETLSHCQLHLPLIDVRSSEEFSGRLTHMSDYPQEGVLRGGHIPGAINIPWGQAANADGTFKSHDELAKIYIENAGLRMHDDTIVYCRIGERSSHTWFVLYYLLGFSRVRNYDGSWTEWGNSVRLPIENPFRAQKHVAVSGR